MSSRRRQAGFTLLEAAISLALVLILMGVLLPALASARVKSYRETCAANQTRVSQAWKMFLEDHEQIFPYVPVQPGWRYGGVRFSNVDDHGFLDAQRPLNPYLPLGAAGTFLCCPGDHGITGDTGGVGTGRRTAFRSFGTSYRANGFLLDARQAGLDEHRALARAEIATVGSRLVLMGDPVWYEVYEQTGRDANWHGEPGFGNVLFVDGGVKWMKLRSRTRVGPAVVEPRIRGEQTLKRQNGAGANGETTKRRNGETETP